jgi:hypothetical protein
MLKRLGILGLAVVICGAWSQIPRDGSQQKQPTKDEDGKAHCPSASGLCNVQIENGSAKQAPDPGKKPSQYPWRELYAPANVPNWVLALVAGWAGVMALKTLWAIRKQVDLQAAGMKQWLEVDAYQLAIDKPISEPINGPLKAASIQIRWRAINRTPLPLTIERVVIRLSRAIKWEDIEIVEERLLPPFRDGVESAYRFFAPLHLDEAQTKSLLAHDLLLTATIRIYFVEASRIKAEQTFDFTLLCSPNDLTPLVYVGKPPTKK